MSERGCACDTAVGVWRLLGVGSECCSRVLVMVYRRYIKIYITLALSVNKMTVYSTPRGFYHNFLLHNYIGANIIYVQ